jgi:tetratricopeptide (TPR) repeat protein
MSGERSSTDRTQVGPGSRSLAEMYLELGMALQDRGRQAEAVVAYERALAEDGAAGVKRSVLRVLAPAYESVGDRRRAVRSYLEAVLDGQEDTPELLHSAHALLTRDVVAAEGDWIEHDWADQARLVARDQKLGQVTHFLARTALYLDRHHDALLLFREASVRLANDARVQEGLGESLWRTGDTTAALEHLRRAQELALGGNYPERLATIDAKLAEVLAASGEYQAALDIIAEHKLEGHPRAFELLLVRARCSLLLGEATEALAAIDAAVKLRSADAQAELIRARALISLGRYDEALASADRASQLEPANREVPIRKAQALLEGQVDSEQGRRILRRAVERWSDRESVNQLVDLVLEGRERNGDAHYFVAEIFNALGGHDVLAEIERALDLGMQAAGPTQRLKADVLVKSNSLDDAARAYYEAGRSFYWQGDYKHAAENFESAVKLRPNDPLTYWYWSDTLRASSFSPGPEQADATLLQQSVDLWNRAANLKQLPTSKESWVYTSRALINEQLAITAERHERRRLWWQSIVFLERAILLQEDDPYRWTYLSRYYKELELEAVAIDAANVALTKAVDNTSKATALDEKAAAAANSGRFSQAKEAISERLALERTAWAIGVHAYLLLHEGRYSEALEAINETLASEPANIWARALRALCSRMLNDREGAAVDNTFVVSKYTPSARDNLELFGTAAYELGKIEEATAIFERASADASENRCSAFAGLAFARLAVGDIDGGKTALDTAIAAATNPRQVEDLLSFDIPGAERASADWPKGLETRDLLDKARESIRKRKSKLAILRSSEEELRAPLIATDLGDAAEWRDLAIRASLARLYVGREAWPEAEEMYRSLQGSAEQFPEATGGLQKLAEESAERARDLVAERRIAEAVEEFRHGLVLEHDLRRSGRVISLEREIGDALLTGSDAAAAAEQYRRMMDFPELQSSPENRADVLARLGYAQFELGNRKSAWQQFSEALRLWRDSGRASPGAALGDVCASIVNDIGRCWDLATEWQKAGKRMTGEGLEWALKDARRSLLRYVDRSYALDASEQRVPLLTPIYLELGQALIPEDQSTERWSLFTKLLPEMRTRIESDTGVKVPGVRVRPSEELDADEYRIMLDEVVVAWNAVRPGFRFSPASSSSLQEAGIPGSAMSRASNPRGGQEGHWVANEYADALIEADIELWPEPLTFSVYHLEEILRENLADFFGVQEAENVLATWTIGDGVDQVTRTIPSDPRTRLRLARTLRSLVRLRLPIADAKGIAETFQSMAAKDRSIDEIVEALRVRSKQQVGEIRSGTDDRFVPQAGANRQVGVGEMDS